MNIAIITASGCMKRIPKKNIKEFCGEPVIAYSIQAALSSNLFNEVMVSTDDEEIAEVSKKYGAKVPFIRSTKNADDFATTMDVLKEVLHEYANLNKKFTSGCCIYPTAPFINDSLLKDAYKKLEEYNYDSVFPVVQYSYPIWRSLKMSDDKVSMYWPENANKRSQDLSLAYHDAGQFYWFKIDRIANMDSLFTENSGTVIIDGLHVQDIDTTQDWQLAELKYKLLQQA